MRNTVLLKQNIKTNTKSSPSPPSATVVGATGAAWTVWICPLAYSLNLLTMARRRLAQLTMETMESHAFSMKTLISTGSSCQPSTPSSS